jgi:hypothetical protein
MPKSSVQNIKRKNRLTSKDLTRLIRKKAFGAAVAYNFGCKTPNAQPIGWYAHFINKPTIFIGTNWVSANQFIAKMPIDNILKRLVPNFILTSFTLKGDAL